MNLLSKNLKLFFLMNRHRLSDFPCKEVFNFSSVTKGSAWKWMVEIEWSREDSVLLQYDLPLSPDICDANFGDN